MKQSTALALALMMMAAPLTGGAKPAKRRAAPRSAPAAAAPAPAPSGAIDKEEPEPSPEPNQRERVEREAPSPSSSPAPAPAPAEPRKPVVAASNDPAGEEAKPAPPPAAPAAAPASSADLEKLRADYDRLRDQLFRARSRAQLVEEALWTSKLSATFRWKGAPDYLVHHASVTPAPRRFSSGRRRVAHSRTAPTATRN